MQRILPVLSALFLGLAIPFPSLVARAQDVQVEVAQPTLRFLATDTGLEDDKIEPSGVAPIGDGSLLLVACDKNENLMVVETATGRVKQWLKLGIFGNRPKWEDLAHDDEGNYYVIGSRFLEEPAKAGPHKKLMDVSRLLRFRLRSDSAGTTPFVIDVESVAEWDIGDALAAEGYHRDPRKNEVNIEGLTVRTLRDAMGHVTLRELVIGIREPHEIVRVYAADITKLPSPNAKLALSPLFRFHSGKRAGIHSQLSSIEYLPAWKGFFILTSTEDKNNRYHGNTLWFLSDKKISASRPTHLPPYKLKLADLRLVKPQKVWVFGLDGKAEGISVLSEEAASSHNQVRRARVALVYDNDTAKTGDLGLVQFITLLEWPE